MRRSVFPRELESAEVGRGFAGFRYKSRGKPSGRICLFCRPSAAAHEEKILPKKKLTSEAVLKRKCATRLRPNASAPRGSGARPRH